MHAIHKSALPVRPGTIPVAIYTRVSTTDQVGGRFDSCESQEALCREHVARHAQDGWYISAVFSDPAYSGGSMKRPGMQALMRHIEQGQVKVVLIFKFERVLRSTDDWVPFRAFLKKHGCRLESPTENLADETATERFHNNLRANLAQYERDNTSDKVRIKMLEQAKRGLWNSGQVPYGYSYDTEAQTLHPNPEEKDIVRRIFESAAQLVSLTEVANALNSEGCRTRIRVFKRRDGTRENVGGKPFRSDLLRKLIRNPIYLGRVRLHHEDFAGKHEPLVERSLWERANAAVEKALRPARCFQSRDKHFHLLKGLVTCVHCGRAMIPNFGGKRDRAGRVHRYYTCGRARAEKAEANCPVGHVPAHALEAGVLGVIEALARRPDFIEEIIGKNRLRVAPDRKALQGRQTELDRRLESLGKRIGNFAEAIAAGGVEAITDELRAKTTRLKEEKQQLLVEREQVRQELLGCDQEQLDSQRITRALGRFSELVAKLDEEEQRMLVALVFESIEVRNVGRVPGTRRPIQRQVELRLKMHSADLVESMEERVVVKTRAPRLPFAGKRSIALDTVIGFRGREFRATEIIAPFHHQLKQPESVAPAPALVHPLHLAVKWNRQLADDKTPSRAALARRLRVSGPTVTRHLQLLELLPEIRDFLLRLNTERELHHFSLNRMVALAGCSAPEQRRRFAALQLAAKSVRKR